MLQHYFPVWVFLCVSFGLALVLMLVAKAFAWLTRNADPSESKLTPFECGFDPFETARAKFDVRFYLVAILFIVFDLEIAFLFPWAVVFDRLGWPVVIAMGIFLLLLVIGFIYEWRKGALSWE